MHAMYIHTLKKCINNKYALKKFSIVKIDERKKITHTRTQKHQQCNELSSVQE